MVHEAVDGGVASRAIKRYRVAGERAQLGAVAGEVLDGFLDMPFVRAPSAMAGDGTAFTRA